MSERVSASSVWKKWLSKVRKTPKKFTRIPRSELDEELCAAALECSPRVYKYIPGDLRTDAELKPMSPVQSTNISPAICARTL